MSTHVCLAKTLSLSVALVLILVGFVAFYYEYHVLLHITALFLALSAVLPIYDSYRECRKPHKTP